MSRRKQLKLTAKQRSESASIAALERWSKEDPQATAERGQAGLLDRFRREISAETPGIVEPELTRRAECRRKAHMKRLAYNREKARRARKTADLAVADGGRAGD